MHQKDCEYNVNELTTIFVTRKEDNSSSMIQNKFTLLEVILI